MYEPWDGEAMASTPGASVTEHVIRTIRMPTGRMMIQALWRTRNGTTEIDTVRSDGEPFSAPYVEGVVHSLLDSFQRQLVLTQGVQLTLHVD